MNSPKQLNPINGTFRFSAVVEFEIYQETAAKLLGESDPSQAVCQWLCRHTPAPDSTNYNASSLRGALGEYLSEKKISEARALLPGDDLKALPSV